MNNLIIQNKMEMKHHVLNISFFFKQRVIIICPSEMATREEG